MNQDLTSYYKERAKEYDRVYQIPEEQNDLLQSAQLFQTLFSGKSVLEIACGTGYWTEQIAKTATAVLATDINEAVIDIAKTRTLPDKVSFKVADMNSLSANHPFEGLFGGFIWSHILIQDISQFLLNINKLVIATGDIVFIDSKPVKGTNHDHQRITRVDEFGNTFQTRKLDNGKTFEVLKNFPDNQMLVKQLSAIATDIHISDLEYYWIAHCKMKRV
jgi:2-polyprenyl-3-methyl-5-hydroxy-6-metoxy-1,4-benzoquinol methylase